MVTPGPGENFPLRVKYLLLMDETAGKIYHEMSSIPMSAFFIDSFENLPEYGALIFKMRSPAAMRAAFLRMIGKGFPLGG